MTKPIEIIHQNFQTKLTTIEKIVEILTPSVQTALKLELLGFTNLVNDYEEYTVTLLCDYYMEEAVQLKCATVDKYMQVIISNNFMTKLDNLVLSLKDHAATVKKAHETELLLLFKAYASTPIDTDIKKVDYKICQLCQAKMTLDPDHVELKCTNNDCSNVVILKGTMFDDSHLYTSEGSVAKRGAYETSRHCRYHLDRILAIKNPNLPQRVLDKIQAWLKQNNFKYLKLVTCPDLRRCLKEIKETKWNEHVPYIRQTICGISPDRLFHHEQRQLYIWFEKAVSAFIKIKDGERANLKYYPYFIFKIIEQILNKPVDKERLQSIVDCIHFQRDNTIVANDKLWNDICDEEKEFVFKKTDKNLLHSI